MVISYWWSHNRWIVKNNHFFSACWNFFLRAGCAEKLPAAPVGEVNIDCPLFIFGCQHTNMQYSAWFDISDGFSGFDDTIPGGFGGLLSSPTPPLSSPPLLQTFSSSTEGNILLTQYLTTCQIKMYTICFVFSFIFNGVKGRVQKKEL